ncbi:hypothetical protein ACS0TY_024724 [Phlomoides rotata]
MILITNLMLEKNDWGFTTFMTLGEFYDPSKGYLVNDTCVVEVEVAVYKAMDPWLYDSKKETGFVGLKNQGATCYMNSLLQTLYHIPFFRKIRIFVTDSLVLIGLSGCVPYATNVNDMPSANISLALQRLFYNLQYSGNSVAIKELTKSFGWETYDAFLQHDVQELHRVLCEKLEEKMKLDVKCCHDVYASFDKYVEVEHLDGDNKYHAEQYGFQTPSSPITTGSSSGRKTSMRIILVSHGFAKMIYNLPLNAKQAQKTDELLLDVKEPGKIYIVLEYCRGGDLSMHIQHGMGKSLKSLQSTLCSN